MKIRASITAIVMLMVTAGAGWTDAFDDASALYRKGDTEGAARVLLPLAEAGDLQAQLGIARIYFTGRLFSRRYAKAFEWYLRAAEQGSAAAQLQVADMYLRRQGVSYSPSEAAKWYRRAAEQGSRHAQYELSRMCGEGRGVPRDYVCAYKWLSVAIRNGYPGRGGLKSSGGRSELRIFARHMTKEQIDEAIRQAAVWEASPERQRNSR
jgi:TPR repeat protein